MVDAYPYIAEAAIKFPTGRLSLVEIQQIFQTIPFELDLIDQTDRFVWFSNQKQRLHPRTVATLGQTAQEAHPAQAWPAVRAIIDSFKAGTQDAVSRPATVNGQRVLIQYFALRDPSGGYLGTLQFTGSIEPILAAKEAGGWADGDSAASSPAGSDAASGASVHPATGVAADSGVIDGDTGASTTTPAGPANDAGVADADTGASEE
ncbi:PAS domain-containing protein [Lacticaseibacillus nasuensis]|uniref:NADPH-dependent FMN reductase n=1 Tax=Lacticaseibacillus nasuensis JCM 17158 TaxID=1291734 RepID=A0A0R1JRP5_9LACO|nr:PAS domain-containing protein [Lacticaseibacillus nasuensis]KRK73950.1 NADPH-dependent FMN reductase [Lacticaseibacillus nasuensis JCM 17158]